jgi:hypothetical protein
MAYLKNKNRERWWVRNRRCLGAMCLTLCLGVRSREGIAALALVMSMVQGFDGIIGILAHDPAKTYGPFVLALANLVALVWLLRR